MSRKPFFSVVVPVHNAETFLPDCIFSVLEQKEDDWELILVDDASTDKSLEIMAEFAVKYPKIRIYKNESNMKVAKTLNHGIERAAGRWIARLDADDCFKPQHLQRLRDEITAQKHNPRIFISAWPEIIDEEGQTILKVRLPNAETVTRMMGVENFICHSATCFSKKAWSDAGGYPVGGKLFEDVAMWLKFFQVGMRLAMVEECTIRYRIHYNNCTSKSDARVEGLQDDEEEKALIRQHCEWLASLFLKQAMPREARAQLMAVKSLQGKFSMKNRQYYLLSYLPRFWQRYFMWYIRPYLRTFVR